MTSKKGLICQLATPVFICLLIVLFRYLIDSAIDADPTNASATGTFFPAFGSITLPYNQSDNPLAPTDANETFVDMFNTSLLTDSLTGDPYAPGAWTSSDLDQFYTDLYLNPVLRQLLIGGTEILYVNDADGSTYPGVWANQSQLKQQGFFGRMPLEIQPTLLSTFSVFGFDFEVSVLVSALLVGGNLPRTFREVATEDEMFSTWYEAHRDGVPRYSSGLMLRAMDYMTSDYRATVYFNNSLTRGEEVPFLMNRVANAITLGLPTPIAVKLTGLKTMPNLLIPPFTLDVDAIVGSFLFFIVLLIPIPAFLAALAFEKETRVRGMMNMMGLKSRYYFLVHYTFAFAIYFLIMNLLILTGYICRFRTYTINAGWSYWFTYFFWGHTMIAFTLLLSTVINRRTTALVSGYLIVFGSALIGTSFVQSQIDAAATDPAGVNGISILPMFALFRGLVYMANEVGFQNPGFGTANGTTGVDSPDAPLGQVWAYLLGEFVVMFLLWAYLEQVVPTEWGVKKHPLFCIGRKYQDPDFDEDEEMAELAPADVKKMREEVLDARTAKKFPLRGLGLTKTFKKDGEKFVAVKPAYFGVKQNETMSVLGHNGAGKTTLIHMLIGLIPPTAGTASVYDCDLREDVEQIHQMIGICPQHDILWDTLSAMDHLEFYGRLRGLPKQLLRQHAWDLLEAVNLAKAQKKGKVVSQFSGGMKRRLAVAISVLGCPKVVFLDEPSTGLDPKSRQDLWAVIQAAKKTSTLFLTTHSMEEADEISDRLIIMSDGRIQCVGSSNNLKNRFGEGLKLSVHLDRFKVEKYEGKLRKWVAATFPGSSLVSSLAGMLIFLLPNVRLGAAFATMERNKKKFKIDDWAITNPTLEEVFLKVIHADLRDVEQNEQSSSSPSSEYDDEKPKKQQKKRKQKPMESSQDSTSSNFSVEATPEVHSSSSSSSSFTGSD